MTVSLAFLPARIVLNLLAAIDSGVSCLYGVPGMAGHLLAELGPPLTRKAIRRLLPTLLGLCRGSQDYRMGWLHERGGSSFLQGLSATIPTTLSRLVFMYLCNPIHLTLSAFIQIVSPL